MAAIGLASEAGRGAHSACTMRHCPVTSRLPTENKCSMLHESRRDRPLKLPIRFMHGWVGLHGACDVHHAPHCIWDGGVPARCNSGQDGTPQSRRLCHPGCVVEGGRW